MEKKTDKGILSGVMNIVRSVGPFHPNPAINEAYMALRLLGMSEDETKIVLQEIITNQ